MKNTKEDCFKIACYILLYFKIRFYRILNIFFHMMIREYNIKRNKALINSLLGTIVITSIIIKYQKVKEKKEEFESQEDFKLNDEDILVDEIDDYNKSEINDE